MSNKVNSLVEAAWLLENAASEEVRILDASWHLPTAGRNAVEEFEQGHIPGAAFFDIDAVSDPNHEMPHMLPKASDFAQWVGRLGIGNDSHVIIYDSHGLFSAARVWWMFRVFGHERVSILNGGLQAWKDAGGLLEIGRPAVSANSFHADFHPEMVRSLQDMKDNLDSAAEHVLDARSAARFNGDAPEPRAGVRGGHIPGSRNLPFDALLDINNKKLLSDMKLRSVLDPFTPKDGKGVICSCGTGVTACVLAFGLHLTGYDQVAIYDGSWTEWGSQDDTPVVGAQ